jgi:hypothetical protein
MLAAALSPNAVRPSSASFAYAEETESPPSVTLMVDGNVYAVVPLTDGQFTVPSEVPQKEGYEFLGWSDGFAVCEPGKTYSFDSSVTLCALWYERPAAQTSASFFSKGEKIAFWSMTGVLCLLFLFSFYWFGIRNYSLLQLKQRIRMLFKRK